MRKALVLAAEAGGPGSTAAIAKAIAFSACRSCRFIGQMIIAYHYQIIKP